MVINTNLLLFVLIIICFVDHIRQTIVSKAQSHTEDGVRVRAVVLDCALVNRADFSAAQGLQGVLEDVRSVGVPLVLMNADPEVSRSLTGLCPDIKFAYSQQQLLQILQPQGTPTGSKKKNGESKGHTNQLHS